MLIQRVQEIVSTPTYPHTHVGTSGLGHCHSKLHFSFRSTANMLISQHDMFTCIVTLQPSGDIVRPLHGNIVYTCIAPKEVQWLINGTDQVTLSLQGVTIASGSGTEVLTIRSLCEIFNETTIQCKSMSTRSEMSHLRLQGMYVCTK